MRIGIDCRIMIGKTEEAGAGIAHATFFLVQSLLEQDKQNKYVLFVKHDYQVPKSLEKENVKIVRIASKEIPIFSRHLGFAKIIKKEKLDIFHGPGNVLPIGYSGKRIVTIHDLAIYKHPEWFPDGQFFSKRIVVPRSIKKAKKIIAISETTKKDIIDIFGIQKEKVKTIYHGFQGDAIEKPPKKPYILFIGTIEPRKNLENLIHAFEILKKNKSYKNLKLVLVGKKGWKDESIWERLRKSQNKEDIEYKGFVTKEQKQILLSQAQVFVFPSLYEGFGIPLLEAMNQGVPIVASGISASKEVLGDSACLVSTDAESISKGIERVVNDEDYSSELIAKGFERVKQFSYKEQAKQTLMVYREVAE